MKVLLAATSLRPTYGGPAYSVSALAVALAQSGCELGVWTPDGSAVDTPLLNGAAIRRLAGPLPQAVRDFGPPDLIHDNGLWWAHNHQLATLASARGVPRVVSIRGMLEPWAFEHKRIRKAVGWRLYQRGDLESAAGHHATAESEAVNIRRRALGVPIHVIPNGVELPAGECLPGGPPTRHTHLPRRALFLGRLHPVKGLPMLIDAWARVRPAGWDLCIAGPDEGGHRAHLERRVSDAGLGSVITFSGLATAERKRALFAEAEFLVLPTHSESFGMAVAEALAHGLPALTTTGAPWPMLPARGCGWWVPPTVEGLEQGLREATSNDAAALRAMGGRGRELVTAELDWLRIAERFMALYAQLSPAQLPLAEEWP